MRTFLYLTLGNGKVTIAISEDGSAAEIGAAFCSPEDQFSKEEGRKRALDRLDNKKDFYISFERNKEKLKWQVRELVNFIISSKWVTKSDIENELEFKILYFVTETVNDFPNDFVPMTVHTNTIPTWAKHAVINKNFY